MHYKVDLSLGVDGNQMGFTLLVSEFRAPNPRGYTVQALPFTDEKIKV